MPLDKEHGIKVRVLRMMRAIIEQPKRYTRQELAERYEAHPDTITNDFKAFVSAGFEMEYDEKYRYYFVKDRTLKKAGELLYFSEEERALLYQAIDNLRTT